MTRAKLLDVTTLRHLRDAEQLTYQQIAERYGATRAAVHLALKQVGVTKARPRYYAEIPWVVKPQHNNDYRVQLLRLAARLAHGGCASDADRLTLQRWMRALSSRDTGLRHGVVVDYDHVRHPEGFAYVAREPRYDTELIRVPITPDGARRPKVHALPFDRVRVTPSREGLTLWDQTGGTALRSRICPAPAACDQQQQRLLR